MWRKASIRVNLGPREHQQVPAAFLGKEESQIKGKLFGRLIPGRYPNQGILVLQKVKRKDKGRFSLGKALQ